jgi:hypothetical protein
VRELFAKLDQASAVRRGVRMALAVRTLSRQASAWRRPPAAALLQEP